MPLRIDELYWDENNLQHLWRSHQVTADEIEDTLLGGDGEEPDYIEKRVGGYRAFLARTPGGRLLSLVGEYLGDGQLYIFSARDMTGAEKRRYWRR